MFTISTILFSLAITCVSAGLIPVPSHYVKYRPLNAPPHATSISIFKQYPRHRVLAPVPTLVPPRPTVGVVHVTPVAPPVVHAHPVVPHVHAAPAPPPAVIPHVHTGVVTHIHAPADAFPHLHGVIPNAAPLVPHVHALPAPAVPHVHALPAPIVPHVHALPPPVVPHVHAVPTPVVPHVHAVPPVFHSHVHGVPHLHAAPLLPHIHPSPVLEGLPHVPGVGEIVPHPELTQAYVKGYDEEPIDGDY